MENNMISSFSERLKELRAALINSVEPFDKTASSRIFFSAIPYKTESEDGKSSDSIYSVT